MRRCQLPLSIVASLAGFLMSGNAAWAQGGQSQTVQEQPQEQKTGVTIGAGSTSSVTTGSSGETGGQPGPTLSPISIDMPYPPQPEGALALPGMLPIEPPAQKRCDVISDDAARQRCAATPVPANASQGQ